jgi:hypothetical protein
MATETHINEDVVKRLIENLVNCGEQDEKPGWG